MTAHYLNLTALATPPEWTLRANCAGTDPEAFFPEQGASNKLAKRVCANCPVRAECLEYGAAEHFGIWGGLSAHERRPGRQAAA